MVKPNQTSYNTRPARRAFGHGDLSRGFIEMNREVLLSEGAKIYTPPRTDYLVIGVCLDPELYDALLEWLPAHTFHWSTRFYVSRGTIYSDQMPVGKITGSRAGTTRYGKKITFHFTGKFFRKPSGVPGDDGGAGRDEALALDLVEQFAKFLVKKEVLPSGWLKFRTIDRWDVCQELVFERNVKPSHFKSKLTLPYGLHFSAMNESLTGQSLYASTSAQPLAKRGDFPLLAFYQNADKPDRIRVEVRMPKVRNVDPEKSFGQEHAARYVAGVLDALSPCPVEMLKRWEDPLKPHPQGEKITVKPITFKQVAPEEYARVPYGGHPAKTLRRMMRQGLTVISRATTAFVTASLLSGCEFDDKYLDNYAESETFHEMCRQAQAGPGMVRHATDDGELSYDLIGAPLPGSEARPLDSGYPVEALRNKVPLNIDEVEEVMLALETYRLRCLPDTEPFWETRRAELASLNLPPDVRLMDPAHEMEILRNVYDSEGWMQRYLDPTSHEPLNCDRRWTACATDKEIQYWNPEHRTPGKGKPDLKIER